MNNQTQIILIVVLIVVAMIIISILMKNARSGKIKTELDAINVRFNTIKTIPLAFKLNKAQAMAKFNEETNKMVEEYSKKYEEAERNLDRLQSLIENAEDDLATKNFKDANNSLTVILELLQDSEEEVRQIDLFLEQFSQREAVQREYSNSLKEQFREIKLSVYENSQHLSIAYEGIEERLQECEDLFSSSEEWMYANEFVKAQEDLERIQTYIKEIEASVQEIPDLVKNAKGVLPVLIDEVNRQFALTRQRGVYLEHLEIEDQLHGIEKALNDDLKALITGNTMGVSNHLETSKVSLNEILDQLKAENEAFSDSKKALEVVSKSIADVERIYHYVDTVYHKENERYALDDLEEILKNQKDKISDYRSNLKSLQEKALKNDLPATALLKETQNLFEETSKDKEVLNKYKTIIDKTSSDENRAISQVMKLQVVLNEVEVKIAQYRLPAISSSYKDDLKQGHQYVNQIKELLDEIPLNIESLNKILDEAIDYIYKLYNNVNNVVGMALMVENAIVFGNKYRSTYPEVDRELSRAEFSYLNGEYTQALTIAIACMENLFPHKVDDRILENAKSAT